MAEMGRRMLRSGTEKSNFAVTCSLLSQYIKEKGSIADLGLGLARRPLENPKGGSFFPLLNFDSPPIPQFWPVILRSRSKFSEFFAQL